MQPRKLVSPLISINCLKNGGFFPISTDYSFTIIPIHMYKSNGKFALCENITSEQAGNGAKAVSHSRHVRLSRHRRINNNNLRRKKPPQQQQQQFSNSITTAATTKKWHILRHLPCPNETTQPYFYQAAKSYCAQPAVIALFYPEGMMPYIQKNLYIYAFSDSLSLCLSQMKQQLVRSVKKRHPNSPDEIKVEDIDGHIIK